MRAKAVTQGGPAPRLRAWAPASARATEKEELGTICLVQTTRREQRCCAMPALSSPHPPIIRSLPDSAKADPAASGPTRARWVTDASGFLAPFSESRLDP